ncbi:MAG: type IV toxin-antitoxin system AbiEi family antitoxin [Anaerolineaceae bacterium]|nr:type IV toxin-antitoxin system AbiEi family antitoxin [Anaerolineaceae bacterium]
MKQTALSTLKDCLEKVPFLQIERIELFELGIGVDLLVQVRIQGRSRLLLAEIKNNGQPRMARLAVYELKDQLNKETDAYGIFIAPYISSEAGKICEEAGIGYLDLAGNCQISFETIYIRQTGAPNLNIKKRDLRSLYSPRAERILRVLLDDPKRRWKMAELAQAAEVSLGQVANIKKLLLDREWLRTSTDGVWLTNPTALLDAWGQAYNFQRNEMKECYALEELLEIEVQLSETCRRLEVRYALTGFSSAARIAPMVRYQKASVYVKGDVSSLIETLGWKAVTSGANVSLLIPYDDGVFYRVKDIDEIAIVSPVQTYLDLQSIRGRGQEAAQAVRKEIEKIW